MKCTEMQKALIAELAGSLQAQMRESLHAHLQECAVCRDAALELRRTWIAMDRLQEQPVPVSVERAILQQAREAVAAEHQSLFSVLRGWLLDWRNPVLPILMGLLTTTVFALVLALHMDLSLIPPLGLTVAGAMWTGLFAIVFYLFSTGMRRREHSWRFLAQTSLVAIGIFFLITVFSPLPHSVRFCSRFSLTQPLMERLSIGGTYFVFGIFYAMIPMGIGAFVAAGRIAGNPLLRGSLAGAVFMSLLAPAIFLQCAPFALGVVLGWFGGALAGSLLGGALGYWLRDRAVRQTG